LKVFEKLGLNEVEFDKTTAMPYEQQFWEEFDILFQLKEKEMMRDLPYFITDPDNQTKV